MSRPRTPTKILELKGAFKKDPQRARPLEPRPNGAIGDPPDYFSEAQCAAWHEVLSIAHPGVLCRADRIHLELTARLIADMRNPKIGITPNEARQLTTLLSKCGMNPADRSRVTGPQEKEANPFDDL